MKKLFTCCFIFLGLLGHSQTKVSFDLATFTIPKNWKKEVGNDLVSYTATNSKTGSYGRIIIFKNLAGSGNIDTDFNTEWKELVEIPYKTTNQPETEKDSLPNGWKIKSGSGVFTFDNKESVVTLLAMCSGNTKMSVLLITNSDEYQDGFLAFGTSLRLKKAPARTVTSPAVTSSNNNIDKRLIGKWNKSGASHPHYADPASWGTAGYTTSRYEFKADGSYVFTERSFRMTYQYIIIVKENGTYTVNGNQLTVVPAKSIIQSYTKKNNVDELGSLVKSQNRTLEKVTYTHSFHYFSGIQEWNLVLQASKPTQRDGNFSNNTTFSNAWYYDQKYTDTDLTSPKGK